MAKVRVVLNDAGIRELLNSAGVRAELTRRMGPVLATAISNAPVGKVDGGTYRDSIHMEQATTGRAVVRVVSDSDHALVVESRTGNLARALDAAGGG